MVPLNRKGAAAFLHGAAHVVPGRAVVPVVAGRAEGDLVLLGLLNGLFSGQHHRRVAQAAVAIDKDRGLGILERAQVGVGVDGAVAEAAAIANHGAGTVRAHAAQVGVGQQLG